MDPYTQLQSMQQHRKWRFIKKKLFDRAAQNQGFAPGESDETAGSKWQHHDYNDDVAILIKVGDNMMWQIGNIEQIGYLRRTLPEDASQGRILNNFHLSEPFPKRVSIHDEKAVFTLRFIENAIATAISYLLGRTIAIASTQPRSYFICRLGKLQLNQHHGC